MERQMQKAGPAPSPYAMASIEGEEDPFIPDLMRNLTISDKTISNAGTELGDVNAGSKRSNFKSKRIEKHPLHLKRSYKKRVEPQKKENHKKKVILLEKKVGELELEIDRLRRKMEGCPECRYYCHKKDETFNIGQYRPNFEEEMKKISGNLNESRGSMGSVEFENIDFGAGLMITKEIDEKAWVYMGIMMIAMGSKCLEVDGSMNVFRILSETVDTLRRQVEKSQTNISMDFYLTQEQMKETNFIDDLGFDPFMEKIGGGSGLSLEGVKVESVEQFQLIYDNKITYNIKYQALLGAMEYIRENSWLTF